MASVDNDIFARMSAEQVYRISGLPQRASAHATKDVIIAENIALRNIIDRCCYQMQRDHAVKKLMEKENESLRQRLFGKTNKPKKKVVNTFARHMTSAENLEALAVEDWKSSMKAVFASTEFKAQKKKVEDEIKRVQNEIKEAEKEVERARKKEEQMEKDRKQAAERAEKAEKRRLDKEERDRKKKEDDERRAQASAERAAKAARTKAAAALKKALADQAQSEKAREEAEVARRKEENALKTAVMAQRRVEAETSQLLRVAATPRVRALATHRGTGNATSPEQQAALKLLSSPNHSLLAPTTPTRPQIRPRPVRRSAQQAANADLDDLFIIRRSGRNQNR